MKTLCLVICLSLALPPYLFAEDNFAQPVPVNTISQAAPLSMPDNLVNPDTPSPVSDERIAGGMEGSVSLDLRNIDVIEALKYLAMRAGANIIATKNVAGRVTLMVENVPVRDIFDIMLRSNGLAYIKQGEIYNVMTEDEYRALMGRKFSDIRKVKVFKLQYAIPEQAFSMIEALKSEIGRVLVESDSGTVLILDTPRNLEIIENALASIEEKNLVQVFTLKYAKSKEIEDQLKPQLDAKKVGTIKADERSNQVIVQALPDRMRNIETLIAALDTKTKQVLIDTQIVKVKLSDELSQGIDWEGIINTGKELGMMYLGSTPYGIIQTATTAAATTLPSRFSFLNAAGDKGIGAGIPSTGNAGTNIGGSKVAPGEALHFGLIDGKRDIDVLIKYLQTLGKTQILSNPKLAVINNQEARIHVGERQAYVTSTTTTGQTTTTVSESVTFVDVGIQLSVTPTINDDGYVTMKIKPEISSVVSTLITPSNNQIPIIDTSMAETTVMVKSGSTIIIGGLRKEEKTSLYDGVPGLSKIPVIGFFFKSGGGKIERTELLIMITPRIVSGDTLTTGDDREFTHAPGREYRDYDTFTNQTDYIPPMEAPEDRVKSYADYSDADKDEGSATSIIGERHEK